MGDTNGQVQVDIAETADLPVDPGGRIALDPDLLNSRDMIRARGMLKGRNPYELIDDPLERVPLIVWCLMTRTDPSFTWDQALDMPFSRLQFGSGEPDPQIDPPGSPGPEGEPPAASGSKPKRRGAVSGPS